ncbi:MAG: trypsin-like peptidase domain-containing protein [Verrucomicrobiae bacterium]|nr:trypsin-like peptidase domain-containing protein [Verrucomicrobiae bacterium]
MAELSLVGILVLGVLFYLDWRAERKALSVSAGRVVSEPSEPRWYAGDGKEGSLLERLNQEQVVMIQQVLPSVVNITTLQPASVGDDFFMDGWDEERERVESGMEDGLRLPRDEGLGAGVIMDEEGFILTNAHVVKHALDIRVRTYDGRRMKARVVGLDELTDLAVLKVEAGGLKAARIGDSDLLQVGEQVWAFGNPYDFNSSVSRGVVSGKNRAPQFTNNYEDFIQSDVVLNPGNSGGALVNSRGEIVGINTAILSGSGAFQGMSFSVPINLAHRVYKEIREGRAIRRGRLGCHLRPLRTDFLDFYKLDRDGGALIVDVIKGSPADRVGLRPLDIVIRCNGERIIGPGHLRFYVGQTAPGEKIVLDYLRGEHVKGDGRRWREYQVEVEIDQLENAPLKVRDVVQVREGLRKKNPIVDVQVVTLEDDFRSRWNVPKEVKGLVVRSVVSQTVASEVLRLGDIIIALEIQGGEALREYSLQEFKKLQEELKPEQKLLLYIYRNHRYEFVVLGAD